MAQPIADAKRIAVGRCAGGAANPDAAAGAGDVLDHHRLTERDREMIGKDARDRVGDPAWRHRHNDRDGARGISLRADNPRQDRQRGSARSER